MAASYVIPREYQRMVEALGPKGAEEWRVKHNLIIGEPAPEGQTMDEELPAVEDGSYGVQYEAAADAGDDDAADTFAAGPLTSSAAMSAYQKAQQRVTDQITANINLLTAAQNRLRGQRVGPSNAEKWFAIAAALGKPTRTGSFGESLGNLGEVLGEQQAAQRKAKEEREALLEQYGLKIGGENLRLLQTGATQAGQVATRAAAAEAAAAKANAPVRGIAVGDRLVNPYTNEEISPPVGTMKTFQGKRYRFLGGDQYDKNNWQEVR